MAKDKSDKPATDQLASDQAAAPAVDPNLQLEVEKLRLQNENLKLQREFLDRQNPPKPAEVEARQQAARIDADRKALDDLAEGKYQFRVHLPGNWPSTQPRDGEPHLLVGASVGGEHGMREAIARYNRHMNIIAPPMGAKYQVQVAGKPAAEVGTESVAAIELLPPADPNAPPQIQQLSI
jgi:hypothetical protein